MNIIYCFCPGLSWQTVHRDGADRRSSVGWTFQLSQRETADVHRGESLEHFHTGDEELWGNMK